MFFETVICLLSSFITTVDNATQTILGGWVESVEDKMLAAGIPVLVRRREQAPFHATIATIHPDYGNSTCPSSTPYLFVRTRVYTAGIIIALTTPHPQAARILSAVQCSMAYISFLYYWLARLILIQKAHWKHLHWSTAQAD